MAERAVDVVVVGGGVMDCAAACHLAKDGRRVALQEQIAVGHGRSARPIERFRLDRPALKMETT